MTISNFRPGSCRIAVLFGTCCFLVFLLIGPAGAETEQKQSGKNKVLDTGGKIQITADRLISNTGDNNAEFVGNVRVRQGETRIDADRLQIIFSDSSGSEDPSPEQSLERLIASGNVKIIVDNRLAVANKAVYITKKRLLTLTGPGAKITSGENTISGETITFHRDNGRFTVEGGPEGRVEAVILPNDSGLE